MQSSGQQSIEKEKVQIAFLPLVCAAPLIFAHQSGLFTRNGLDVELIKVPGWSGVKDLLAYGHIDAAHMLAPMPLAVSLGIDGKQTDVILSVFQNVNGQALTLANCHKGLRDVREMKGFTFGVPYLFSMHYYLLCYYLAAGGLHPLKDVTIREVAPPAMPLHLAQGMVDGIFAPEPFNQLVVHQGIGFIYRLSKDIWPGHPCCSLATTRHFMQNCPHTYRAILKSVVEAEYVLHSASPEEKAAIAVQICGPEYLNQIDPVPVVQALTGDFPDGTGVRHQVADRIDFLPRPWGDYGTWIVSQMQRWGQLPGKVNYNEIAENVFADKEVVELADAVGFNQSKKPGYMLVPAESTDPLQAMIAQPFCSYKEGEIHPPREIKSAELPGQINTIVRHLAKAAGGMLDDELAVNVGGDFGQLKQLINDLTKNLRFQRDANILQNEILRREIAEREKMKERLFVAEKMRTIAGLAAGVAHEINTPLSAILQSIQIIRQGFSPDLAPNRELAAKCHIDLDGVQDYFKAQEIDFFLRGINDSAVSASKIIKNLLEFSRPHKENMTSTSLPILIDNTVALARADYDLNRKYDIINVQISKEYDADLPEIFCAAMEIEQVVLNLIKNAVQAMADQPERTPNPHLVIRTSHHGNLARIEIEDNGPGMTEEVRCQAFDPFFTTKDVGEGTGLGLSVSYTIICDRHKGSIQVESEPNQGTKFVIELPLTPNEFNTGVGYQ